MIYYGLPYWRGGSDDKAYETIALELYEKNIFSLSEIKSETDYSTGFEFILVWIIRLSDFFGGYHTIIFRLLNIGAWMICCLLITDNMSDTENKKCEFLLYLLFLFPNALYISMHIFRDTISALVLILIYWIQKNSYRIKKQKLISSGIVISLLIFGYTIRRANILYGIATILIVLLANYYSDAIRKEEWSILLKRKKTGIGCIVFVILLTLILIVFMASGYLAWSLDYSLRYVNYYGNILEGRGSHGILSVPLLPFGIFFRMLYGLCVPFPSGIVNIFMHQNIETITHFLTSLGTVTQIALLPFLVKGVKKNKDIFLMFLMTFFSVICTTFTFRHFIYVYPFMIYLIVDGLFRTDKKSMYTYLCFMILVEVILGCVYLVL